MLHTRVVNHVQWMVVGTVMLVDGVIQSLIHCGDDCIAAHVTVIFVAGVPEVAVKEEHIAGLHFNGDELKHFEGRLKSWLIHNACLITNSAVFNAACLVAAPQDAQTAILHCTPNINMSGQKSSMNSSL